MLQMIFRFYVNSGEHDFFVKRLKNMAVAAQSDVPDTSIGRRGVSYSQQTTQDADLHEQIKRDN